ncbi:MAG: SMC-Scp complex subunit ScpB [Candidatus Magasanikbacteria bacterium]|nr:SMC-Scp complex subunit ScpB [Candidatus Magasanikbacteria bacterium]
MELISQIESIIFVASKPLSARQIAKALGQKTADVELALEDLKAKYNQTASGLRILHEGEDYQMATNPDNSAAVDLFIKDEAAGELTRPQLETLTVIAYRGPITRPELEQIRGVNCAIILRNLLMRGLIDEHEDEKKILPVYSLSMEAVRHLGISSASELPDYDSLRKHEYLENTLNTAEQQS